MKVVIEFYRTREADDAHAVLGRQSADVFDLEDAIGVARRLSHTLAMPQQPDALSIRNAEGDKLYAGACDGAASPPKPASP